MQAQTAANVASNAMNKGDVLGTARFAGVQAAKEAASLLPLCGPVLVRNVSVDFNISEAAIDVEAVVDCFDRSGVEMQAFAAATVAALTIYDMCKSADRAMSIGPVVLWERSGDPSNDWRRRDDPD
jgi:cyclic pyranopterin phosphate synthase